MRNGLTKTLAAIAIACLGYQAYAVAPVVNEIPAVIVTDDTQGVTGATTLVTTPNTYVYEDFVNLNDYVSDDGPLSSIIWSYMGAGANGASSYRLNGATPLTTNTAAMVISPPAGSVINSAANLAAVTDRGDGTAGEYNPDNNVMTPTIRDNLQSPMNAFYTSYPDTSGDAVGTVENSEKITLYASDGTTASAGRSVMVYSVHGQTDHLSFQAQPTPVSIRNLDFTTGTNVWVTSSQVGAASFSFNTASPGMCITVDGPTDPNIGKWVSPYGGSGGIPLVANSVWRIRAQMTTNQTTPSDVPLWDLLVENLNVDVTQGDEAYLADDLFLDNVGSANAIKGPSAGRNVFDMWYTPAAVMTSAWNAGAFTAGNDAANDMEMEFRVLDAGISAGYGGQFDSGRICVTNLNVDRFDMSKLYTVGNPDVYDLETMVNGTNGVSVIDFAAQANPGAPGTGSIKDFSGGVLTLTPQDPNGWLTEATVITPGNLTNPALNSGNDAEIVDNYPVVWEGSTLYQIEVQASAPDAMGENNGPDALLLSFDTKTNELLGDSYMTTGLGRIGMPHVGAPQTYTSFFWSHSATNETATNANRLRWKIQVFNTPSFDKPLVPGYGTDPSRNLGGITIHSVKVRKVMFIGMN